MIDYQEFCDRFWIAANMETERMFARSESRPSSPSFSRDLGDSGSEDTQKHQQIDNDRFSFARLLVILNTRASGIELLPCAKVEMADEQESSDIGLCLQ